MPVFSRCRCHSFVMLYVATERGPRVKVFPRQNAGFGLAGICRFETYGNSASECRGHGLWCERPCPGFLLFLNFRILHCRLVSLTSVLKDSVSSADISSTNPARCIFSAPISSLPELHELRESIPPGASSPEASPFSSSLSMGTIPRDDESALVSSDSDPKHPLNPTVDSDPDDDCCVTCWDHSGLEHMPSIANPFTTSFPCTLTSAGTCSHLTSLPGFAISWSSISQTVDLQLAGCGRPSL